MSILATSTLITVVSIKVGPTIASDLKAPTTDNSTLLLERMLYIHHLLRFKKYPIKIKALLNFDNKVNVITPTYVAKLSFEV